MIKAEYSTHKSVMFAIREAMTLYLFDKNREKDIPKIAEMFLLMDSYDGDRVPISAVMKEMDALCNTLQDNYLGLNLNFLVNIESLPSYKSISECIRPFANVNNELPFLLVSRLICCSFPMIARSVDLKLSAEKGMLRFDFISNAPDVMNKHQLDSVMVLVYRIVEAFYPGMLKKLYVAQRHTAYELEYYQSVFGAPAESANKTSLVYALKCKDHYKNAASLLIKAEEELGRKFYINPLFNMLFTQFSEISYKQRCEIIIDTMMGVSSPTRIQVADSMNISVSTLRRRLHDEGATFQEILEETRKRLAKLYLTERKISTTDVAYLLGYKSHSQFFKVFKTWFGITPKTYQSNQLSHIEDNI
ncbi:helix-turn-helix transcriptional regulator [Psychrobacter sp. NG25]|uniref:helix-turn-helix transcriptional regulator n=1 Tax=Psychrobacter sp. NG25 TaxID=2782005 RepID=UPI0018838083|nr:helix-turn-helix transcriptional regulator [Psychrobacter sp. NG25]MBF0659828.1 helix-turn-helix transcriptional regulator [Psychrobacter sp. NG25]